MACNISFPPSNENCQCNEIYTPEGRYRLKEEIFQQDTQAQYNVGTHISFFCPTQTEYLIDKDRSEPLSRCTTENLIAPNILSPSISDSQLLKLSNDQEGSTRSLFGYHKHHGTYKKPKTSLSKSKSCFLEYVTNNEKLIEQRTNLDSNIFYNVGLKFFWNDEYGNPKEPISKLSFCKAYPTCHDINAITSSKDHIDVIIGFSSGDFIWYDTVCNRYSRINKNGIMNSSQVTMVKWLPENENLFMASFDDGTILILDKEREDQSFSLPDQKEHFQITKPNKHSKHNPVAHWRVSKKGITAFAFSPNYQYVSTVGKDGLMRTIDYTNERLCDVFVSYFGRLLCVAWSPDGKYILTGGQDDLITIWSFKETKIIARCQGHRSWVTSIAFDPLHCDDKSYRFASVGEDCKLILWDFSVNALHKPKQLSKRLSISSSVPLNELFSEKDSMVNNNNARFGKRFRKRSLLFGSSSELLLQPSQATQHVRLPTIHPALRKCQVPFLQPIVKQTIHPDPCVDIVYRLDSIVTTDRRGRIRAWGRPSFITK